MRKITLLLVLFLIGLLSKGQTVSTQNLLLHTSKTTGKAGEFLPFKCYIINSVNHIGEDNNLYIILFNKLGNVVFKDRYPVFNSSASGNIALPKELTTGKYTIGAFTPYMINNKIIKYNQLYVENLDINNTDPIIQLNTFVNNSLVCNVPNTLFIKAEKNEIPSPCKLTIVDKYDKEVQQFFTDINGIAKINFTPARNQEYSIVLNNKKHFLPKIDSIGINMQTSFDKNVLNFLVNKNYKIATADDFFTITAYQKDIEVYKTNFSFENYASVSAGVNVEALPSGLVKIVVHNKDKISICSTYVYLNNPKNFDIPTLRSSTNQSVNKSVFELNFQQKAMRFLSAAITKVENSDSAITSDLDFFYTRDQQQFPNEDIVSFYEIGLQSQTQKYIVLKPTRKTFAVSDLAPKITDEYGVVIRGKVYDPAGQNILANGYLNFTSTTKDSTYNYSTKVKSDGSFILDSLFFNGTHNFEYTYLNSNKKEASAKIRITQNNNDFALDSLLSNSFTYIIKPKNTVVAVIKDSATAISKPNNIEQKAKENKKEYATGVYASNSSVTIDNIKNPPKDGNMNGATFVKNRIQNVAFQGGNIVNTKNLSLSNYTYWPIGIVIDEVLVTVADLNLLTANEIGIVKFFEPGHIAVSTATPGGIIAIYTKNKILQGDNGTNVTYKATLNGGPQLFEYTGFSEQVNNSFKKVNHQNLHNIFYWNPSIILNKDQTTFSFETENLEPTKIYKLIISGYNELGKLIFIEKNITN